MTPISSWWVIEGDNAQKLLWEQGYQVSMWQTRHGIKWALMVLREEPSK